MKVSLSVTFDTERDTDILKPLEAEGRGNRSKIIREALRLYYSGGITLQDVYAEVRALREAGLHVTPGAPQSEPPAEPPDVAAALDELGK